MKKKILSTLKRYAKRQATGKGFNWEKLGCDIRNIAEEEIKLLQQTQKYKDALYGKQCNMRKAIHKEAEGEYYGYFEHPSCHNMYDWVNGNDSWKELVNSFKK